MEQVTAKLDGLKIDNGGNTVMIPAANYYSDDFGQLGLPLSTIDIYFGQLISYFVPSKQVGEH